MSPEVKVKLFWNLREYTEIKYSGICNITTCECLLLIPF